MGPIGDELVGEVWSARSWPSPKAVRAVARQTWALCAERGDFIEPLVRQGVRLSKVRKRA